MKPRALQFDTCPDDLKIGETIWDSSQRIRVIQLWEGQIWNFYEPTTDHHGRFITTVKSSVFVPGNPAV